MDLFENAVRIDHRYAGEDLTALRWCLHDCRAKGYIVFALRICPNALVLTPGRQCRSMFGGRWNHRFAFHRVLTPDACEHDVRVDTAIGPMVNGMTFFARHRGA